MSGAIRALDRPADAEIAGGASRTALVVLFVVWILALIAYFEAFLATVTIPQLVIPHNPVSAFLVTTASGLTSAALITLTLPLAALLALTRVFLPEPDRNTLGILTGTLIVMVDVAMLGNRHGFTPSRELAPLLGTFISIGALRIVITAALRRCTVRKHQDA